MKPSARFIIAIATVFSLAAAVRADSEKPKGFELKNRSSFHVSLDARIPFWPIGWTRPAVRGDGTIEAPVSTAKVQLLAEHFSVTSVLLGHPALATINGRSFEEGELLPVIYGSERLRVVVRSIRDGGVILEYDGKQIAVPMKRPELGAKQVQQNAEPGEFVIKIGPSAKK